MIWADTLGRVADEMMMDMLDIGNHPRGVIYCHVVSEIRKSKRFSCELKIACFRPGRTVCMDGFGLCDRTALCRLRTEPRMRDYNDPRATTHHMGRAWPSKLLRCGPNCLQFVLVTSTSPRATRGMTNLGALPEWEVSAPHGRNWR